MPATQTARSPTDHCVLHEIAKTVLGILQGWATEHMALIVQARRDYDDATA